MSDNSNEWPKFPKILEINTAVWLNNISMAVESPISLLNLPEEVMDIDFENYDAIWLMGVWERSPKGREIALKHPGLQYEYQSALKDFKPEDVIGSPYAVYDYQIGEELGGLEGLQLFREQLAEKNVSLILDYVSNHVALDHHWTSEKPDMFIKGSKDDLVLSPNNFFNVKDRVYAHGRDPYFDPWTDTVQINAFSTDAREQAVNTLLQIADLCDGVRCDMAMLLTNKVFSKTWGVRAGEIPEKDFWREIIPAVKEKHPNFLFLAEVYWDMEWELQQQGFDYCYDKRLYDRLRHDDAQSVQAHLRAEWDYQSKLLRFIENHDEQRAASAFGAEKSKAAAILTLNLPGAKLIHDRQPNGYKIKIPIQLKRGPVEKDNQDLIDFYSTLISAEQWRKLAEGKWSLCNVEPVSYDNISFGNLIAYCWWKGDFRQVIIVNYSPHVSQGHIRIPELNYGTSEWTFVDRLTEKAYTYKGEDLNQFGLYVDLGAWNSHIFDVKKKKK